MRKKIIKFLMTEDTSDHITLLIEELYTEKNLLLSIEKIFIK